VGVRTFATLKRLRIGFKNELSLEPWEEEEEEEEEVLFLTFQCFFNKMLTKSDTSFNALSGIVLAHIYGTKKSVSGNSWSG
jgi:hypothetical protein